MGLARDKFAITLLPYKLWDRGIQSVLRNPDNIMNVDVELNQEPSIQSIFTRRPMIIGHGNSNAGTVKIGVWADNVDLPKFFVKQKDPFSMLLTFSNTSGNLIRSIMLEKVKYQDCEIYEDQFSGVMYPEIIFSFENHIKYFHGTNN